MKNNFVIVWKALDTSY